MNKENMNKETYNKEEQRLYGIKRRLDRIRKEIAKSGHALNGIGIDCNDVVVECLCQIVKTNFAVGAILSKMDMAVMKNFISELEETLK